MYDGVVSRMHESAGALMSSYAHDLDTTNLSLTVMFLEGEKINSNVTNDIEVISSLSSDLSSVCLPNCFIFLQTGRAFWFWPMLAGAPKLLWPLLMKAQSTNAHRRCCEWKRWRKIESLLIYESEKSMNSLSNSPRHLRHLGRMDHRRRLMLMSQTSISSIEGHRLEIEQKINIRMECVCKNNSMHVLESYRFIKLQRANLCAHTCIIMTVNDSRYLNFKLLLQFSSLDVFEKKICEL